MTHSRAMHLIDLYEQTKTIVVPKGGPIRSLAHVHFGLAIYMLTMLAMRRPAESRLPWIVVFMLECVNEMFDMWGHWTNTKLWRLRDNGSDILYTMLWPTIIYLVLVVRQRRTARATR